MSSCQGIFAVKLFSKNPLHLRFFGRLWTAGLITFSITLVVLTTDGFVVAQEVQYNRDVLPILAENCFHCHGFDQGKREAGLRLDSAEGASQELDSGERAIIPGKVAQSALVERIFTTDTDALMPPEDSGKQLTPA